MSARRQELLDHFYTEHGPCCAGCDWWRSMNSRVGECLKSAPVSGEQRFGMVGSAIPSGMHVLHRCDNPGCVNPDHLFSGTPTDNMQDCAAKGRIVPGGHSAKTHCANGHEYTAETSYVNASGFRRCRVCHRDAKRKAKAARLAAP